ncbi:MAG: 2-hydroxyacyl-CoA dehydratase [Deltaproteobacteria bacterium]|nr:2-hydroxyacyl-CoA dehydratase [Deltaproteobacteria bacterium]
MSDDLTDLVRDLERRFADLSLAHVTAWKAEAPGRKALGCMPVFCPREVLWAAGALPVFIRGGGDQLETIRGDAYYQSYICHLPRSTLELCLGGWLDALDGMLFPNTCDVIRNLSGLWSSVAPGRFSRFLDPPQTYDAPAAVGWWRGELSRLYLDVCAMTGTRPSDEALWASISAWEEPRGALAKLSRARAAQPWNLPADEVYLLRRAGDAMPPREFTRLVDCYLACAVARKARREDRIRVVLVGAFCEQPPLGLLRALERAGCYLVDDDLLLGAEDLVEPVDAVGDPLDALARAYLVKGAGSSVRYDEQRARGLELARRARSLHADGVVFAAPSFCDPALLDQPRLTRALDEAGVPYTAFKYSEDTGQFQSFREQAGTFSDSVKLWGRA